MTRYRLTSDATAPAVTPAFQTYLHSQDLRRKLLASDSSALTNSAYTPDAADHLVAGDALHIQFVSDPLAAGMVFTSGNLVQLAMQGSMPNNACNQSLQLFVSVVNSSGVEQAVIRSKVAASTEWPSTTMTTRIIDSTLDGSYTTAANDRLVVEIGSVGTPGSGGGIQGHNQTLRWGSSGAGGDITAEGQTGTIINPWFEIGESLAQTKTDALGITDSVTALLTVDRAFTQALGLVDSATYQHTPGSGDSHTRTIQRIVTSTLTD